MKKITKEELKRGVWVLNNLYKKAKKDWTEDDLIEIDHAACYGGYCLTTHKGSKHLNTRGTARDLERYLRGAIDFVKGGYVIGN